MINKCYCPVCQKEQFFDVVKKFERCKENDIEFEFQEKVAICKVCGEELLLDEIIDQNQVAYEEALKKASNVISKLEIESVIDKYRIKKRNLSLVLGLGEQTITRYLDGYIPTKKISDLLRNILDKPEDYLLMLEKNKEKISKQAYVRSKNKINEILNINENDTFIEDVADYVIAKNEETTNLVLQKLLYYVEFFYMMFNGKNLYSSQCRAWKHGPVYGRIYYEYKEFGCNPIEQEKDFNNIEEDLTKIINSVIANFGCYSGKVLSYFTHNEDPWKNARLKNEQNIDKVEMLVFSKKIKKEYGIEVIDDISKYSKHMFKEYESSYGN